MKHILMLMAAVCCILTGCAREPEYPPVPTELPLPVKTEAPEELQLLSEQVIHDSDGIRITVKGMEENTMAGTRIRVLVENGTVHNIAFSGDLFVVNGVTMPGYLYTEVAAGMKSNDAIELYSDALDAAGIVEIGTLQGADARIVDTDTYETLAAVPFTLETAYAQGLKYTPDESGVELFRAEDITVIAQVISEEFYGRTARLLVKNDSDDDIIVEAENISVNGYTVDAWLYDMVCEDTVRYCQLDLFETGLAENGIERIETITFRLNILDAEDYETVARSELLTVEVKG